MENEKIDKKNFNEQKKKFIVNLFNSKDKRKFVAKYLNLYLLLFSSGQGDYLNLFNLIKFSNNLDTITIMPVGTTGNWVNYVSSWIPEIKSFSGARRWAFTFPKSNCNSGVASDFHGIGLFNSAAGTFGSFGNIFPNNSIAGWIFEGQANNCQLWDFSSTSSYGLIPQNSIINLNFAYDGNQKFALNFDVQGDITKSFSKILIFPSVPTYINLGVFKLQVNAAVANPIYVLTDINPTDYSNL